MANPKVFSLFQTKNYSDYFPQISVLGKKVDFYLECSTYDVILPVKVKGNKQLDVFEEAVLKLIAYKKTTIEDMADILCLTSDLINFIIIRLQEVDLLADNGRDLTEKGKQYVQVEERIVDDENIDFEQAKLFVLNQTGEILPYIQKGELISEPIDSLQRSSLTVEFGTVGSPVKVKGKILQQKDYDKKVRMLQSSSIRDAIAKYNRIVRNNGQYNSIEYARQWAIENTSSDNVYFHMQAVVQNGNVDEILVSDGFVVNVDSVNDYIKKNYPDFISVVKRRANRRDIIKESENTFEESRGTAPDQNYPELRRLLSKINSFSNLYTMGDDDLPKNSDEIQILKNTQKDFLLKCYSSIEWSLYYYYSKNKINDNIRDVIENQNSYQNAKTLLQMAKKIGVMEPQRYEPLLHSLDRNRMTRLFKTKTPELKVVLSLIIISSAYNSQCEFRELLQKRPGLFRCLLDLHKERSGLAHQTYTTEIDKERNKEVYDLLIDVVSILQPDYDFGENIGGRRSKGLSHISQERLNAEVSLSNRLGALYYYNLLPDTIKEEWLLVSPDKRHYPEAAEYVDILYRIMQDTLYYALRDIRKNPQLEKSDILIKLKKNGIVSESYSTVNEVFVGHILMNENSTLGAHAMVYLYYQSNDLLEKLKKANFTETIEKLVEFRKHGNNVALTTNTQELNEIRDNMLDIVKSIGGN